LLSMSEQEAKSASAQGERPTAVAAEHLASAAAQAPGDDATSPRHVKMPTESARDVESN
jgi:hypothetical protein